MTIVIEFAEADMAFGDIIPKSALHFRHEHLFDKVPIAWVEHSVHACHYCCTKRALDSLPMNGAPALLHDRLLALSCPFTHLVGRDHDKQSHPPCSVMRNNGIGVLPIQQD